MSVLEDDEGVVLVPSKSSATETNLSFINLSLEHDQHTTTITTRQEQRSIFRSFFIFSMLFALNHSSGLACLALSAPILGDAVGSLQSALLYGSYTLSSLAGATWLVGKMGPKSAVIFGMILFCGYVGCFLLRSSIVVYMGGVVGGVGSGVAWTGQGVHFALSAERYANEEQLSMEKATSTLAAVFACWILVTETCLESLSTLLVRGWGIPWNVVFLVYFFVAVASSIFMAYQVPDYRNPRCIHEPILAKTTAALRLLVQDPRMKYMVFFNISFGFAGAFLIAFVSSQVVPVAIGKSSVGLLAGIHGMVAAGASMVLGYFDRSKIFILLVGSLAFACVALPFLFLPDPQKWNWVLLLCVYSVEGIGRATFESTLKALFADYFSYEKEGAFANIILQYGIASTLGYFFVDRMHCSTKSDYCIQYDDGSFHSILLLCMTVILAGTLSAFCFVRAFYFDLENNLLHGVEAEESRNAYPEHLRDVRLQESICSGLHELS